MPNHNLPLSLQFTSVEIKSCFELHQVERVYKAFGFEDYSEESFDFDPKKGAVLNATGKTFSIKNNTTKKLPSMLFRSLSMSDIEKVSRRLNK